ncbi:hypothetical protein T484DRAFT_1806679 [Baffinella frigidus]|nr:hypothetical protein T484DRAFT_1806679 [Cryptophyta sp. CCMP2293]
MDALPPRRPHAVDLALDLTRVRSSDLPGVRDFEQNVNDAFDDRFAIDDANPGLGDGILRVAHPSHMPLIPSSQRAKRPVSARVPGRGPALLSHRPASARPPSHKNRTEGGTPRGASAAARPTSAPRTLPQDSSPGRARPLSARPVMIHERQEQRAQPPATVRPSTASARVQLHARIDSVPEDAPRRVIGPSTPRGNPRNPRPHSSPSRATGGPRGGSPRVRPSTAGASPWAEGAAFLTQQLEEEGGWGDGAAPGVEEAVREAAGRAQAAAVAPALVRTQWVSHPLPVSPRRPVSGTTGGFSLRPHTAGSIRSFTDDRGNARPPPSRPDTAESRTSTPMARVAVMEEEEEAVVEAEKGGKNGVTMVRKSWAAAGALSGSEAAQWGGKENAPAWGKEKARRGFDSASLSLKGMSAEEWGGR